MSSERRADELVKGDRLDIGGTIWTVVKAKRKGKAVRLGIESRRGSFTEDVKAKSRYVVITAVEAPRKGATVGAERAGQGAREKVRGPGPLLDRRGAMTRWEDLEPPGEPKKADPWEAVAEVDRVLIEELGAKLIGVEVEGGKLVVPPVTDATIFGHLLAMHGRRFDGATMAEAKAWAREHDLGGAKTAEQVLGVLDFEKAYALHEEIHGDLLNMPTPHWHREEAPR